MATINWKRLLDTHGVEYIEHGSSVVKGNIAVHCVFCGNADGGHHMGINLSNSYWGCWRNKSHRGKSPVRLLLALLKISYAQALEIAGLDESFIDPDGYASIKNNLFHKQEAVEQSESQRVTVLEMSQEFEELNPNKIRTLRFINYLIGRGFPKEDINGLCKFYNLRAAVSGDFKDRIILPYMMDGNIVTWTGRAIGATNMRYLDLSIAESVLPAKRTFYNFNATSRKAKILLVQEGPMDSLKVDMYAKLYGVRSISISTNSITEDQTYLLEEVSVNFDRVMVMMDAANSMGIIDSMKLKEKLAQIKNIGFVNVPFGKKDGGELTPQEVIKFAKELTR